MQNSPKKILLFIPTLQQGGAERVMSELANEWCSLGNKVFLVLFAKNIPFYALDENIEVIHLGFDNQKKYLLKLFDFIRAFLALRRQIKNVKPDFVLSFMDRYNLIAIMASQFLNTKVFVSDRANPYEYVPKIVAISRKFIYQLADGIIAQTQLAKKYLISQTHHKNIEVIHNPVKAFDSSKSKQREKIILNVGRLVTEKGQFYLLDMMAKANLNDWKLVVLGDGFLRNDLENRIKALNIGDKVELLGTVSNVDDWLFKASIFAFPSISEGFPNALVEAMAAGLPCVSFDCNAGPNEIIDHEKNGYLVPVGDVETFTSYVLNLIDNPTIRKEISIEAKKIAKKLDCKNIAQHYFNFCTKE